MCLEFFFTRELYIFWRPIVDNWPSSSSALLLKLVKEGARCKMTVKIQLCPQLERFCQPQNYRFRYAEECHNIHYSLRNTTKEPAKINQTVTKKKKAAQTRQTDKKALLRKRLSKFHLASIHLECTRIIVFGVHSDAWFGALLMPFFLYHHSLLHFEWSAFQASGQAIHKTFYKHGEC